MTMTSVACARPQVPEPPTQVRSPEVDADKRVTFRVRAPLAKEVSLLLEGAEQPVPMVQEGLGVWRTTTGPLAPDFYGYSFVFDGMEAMDPANPLIKPNLLRNQSVVHVPGPASLPWEIADVPHGVLHRHFYRSDVAGDQRDYYVYTPPGYDSTAPQTYPVLYLLHGFSDDAAGWTAVGRAHVIFDNLIARGAARSMIAVMPLGYGAPEILAGGFSGLNKDLALRQHNYDSFRRILAGEVLPRVESTYRVTRGREARAIAGLSMGGTEALLTGLNDLDDFAWVGSFSAGGLSDDFDAQFPRLDSSSNPRVRLLWIACGVDDRLMEVSRKLRGWLDAKGVAHAGVETPGGHVWMLWRRNLAEFAALLFR